jgi:hypothetical protein
MPSTETVPESADGLAPRLLRAGAVALCLLLALAAVVHYLGWRGNRDRLLGVLAEAGIDERNPEAIVRVSRERTPHHARLTAARALVYDVLSFEAGAPPTDLGARVARLEEARELARRALRDQPNSWQASMLLGAATYLEWSLTADPRLFTEYSRWEEPLRTAVAATEGKVEPRRFLAAAYLESWVALGEEKKAYAEGVLAEVFRDDAVGFARLMPVWLEVAGSRRRAFELVPDQPWAWRRLELFYARRRDWRAYAEVRGRHLDALEGHAARELDEAAERKRLGDLAGSRAICLEVVASAPPSRRFAPTVARAFEIYPPGIHALRSTAPFEEWLRLALRLHPLGVELFPVKTLERLVDVIRRLDPPEGAYAALIADDVYRMQLYEKQADTLVSAEWAPYLIAKAGWLLERDPVGNLEEADRALDRVALTARGGLAYLGARREVARAGGDQGALAAVEAELEARRAELTRHRWTALDWRLQGERAFLDLLPETAGPGLLLELRPKERTGAAVEILWDGTLAAVAAVPNGGTLTLDLAVDPGRHLLEVRGLERQEVLPGSVRLRRPR